MRCILLGKKPFQKNCCYCTFSLLERIRMKMATSLQRKTTNHVNCFTFSLTLSYLNICFLISSGTKALLSLSDVIFCAAKWNNLCSFLGKMKNANKLINVHRFPTNSYFSRQIFSKDQVPLLQQKGSRASPPPATERQANARVWAGSMQAHLTVYIWLQMAEERGVRSCNLSVNTQ